MFCSRITFCIVTLLLPLLSFGFDEEYFSNLLKDDTVMLSYFKKVGSDSAHIYFTDDFKFTEATCARIVRYTPLNEKGFQTGIYRDYTIDKRLIGMGGYQSSLRHGIFEAYYEDGQVKSRGNFIDDKPVGDWKFFDAHGNLQRQVNYDEKNVKLIFTSHHGKSQVKNGNGRFKGSIYSLVLNQEMYATGQIHNGFMEGKWKVWQKTSEGQNELFATEYFNNGKFILGSLASAGNRFQREYFTKSITTLLEPEYYFLIEQGKVVACETLYMVKPELVYVNTGLIKSLVNNRIRQQQNLFRTVKTEQGYYLHLDQNGIVINIEKADIEDHYHVENDLIKILKESRWKPGQNSEGPTQTRVKLIVVFTPTVDMVKSVNISTRIE